MEAWAMDEGDVTWQGINAYGNVWASFELGKE